MESMFGTLTVVSMFALRLLVPIVLAAVVVYAFRRVDLRWQNQAWEEERAGLTRVKDAASIRFLEKLSQPCWDEMGCEESDYRKCPGHKQAALPCWMARRWAEGSMPAKCYNCERFTLRPATVPVH